MLKYLDYLEKEAQMMACHLRHDRLSSVYVGGGTPNLLHAEDYIRLMNITRRIFGEPSEGVERTLEGIPQLFNHDKVQAIKEADRKSTRLNSSHLVISYAVFCLKKKKPDGGGPVRPRTEAHWDRGL